MMPEDNENIVGYMAGIVKSSSWGYEFLGVGKTLSPENALIITDKRILFIVVPLPGAGMIIGGANITMLQWLSARKDIENKLKEMISSMSLQQIIESNPKNYIINISDIKKVKVSKFFGSLAFVTNDNKKYKYTLRNKEDLERTKVLFQNFI